MLDTTLFPAHAPRICSGNLTADEVALLLWKRDRKAVAVEQNRCRFGKGLRGQRAAFPQPAFIDVLGTLVFTGAATNFATFTTAKTVLPTNALCVLPPGYWVVGRCLEVDVWGLLANIVTTPGTVTFQIMLGAIVVFTSGAVQMNATAHTANPFWFHALLTCRAVGATTSASFMGQSYLIGKQFTPTATTTDANRGAASETTDAVMMGPETTPTVGTGFDSTAATTLDFWVGFSSSNSGNNVTVQGYKAISWV